MYVCRLQFNISSVRNVIKKQLLYCPHSISNLNFPGVRGIFCGFPDERISFPKLPISSQVLDFARLIIFPLHPELFGSEVT